MTPTQATLQILAAIGRLQETNKFQPLTSQDRMGFDGASDTALIAYTSDPSLLTGLMHLPDAPETIMTEGEQALMVIVSDARVEMHGLTAAADPFCYGFDLGDLM